MKLTVVRPYREEIRERVFSTLEKAGLEIDSDRIIPPGTPDEEAIEVLESRPGDALLVPFHAQRDEEGHRTNGIELLNGLSERVGVDALGPVIMPVSRFGAGAARLLLSPTAFSDDAPQEELRNKILLITEEEIDEPDLPARIRNHLLDHGGTEAGLG
ncbi:MAG: hypothetical protein R3234_03875 [Thermoanaerobaculia bacterium]|nr:hypothetical protein [Thermoanaerobaculia bacterium]